MSEVSPCDDLRMSRPGERGLQVSASDVGPNAKQLVQTSDGRVVRGTEGKGSQCADHGTPRDAGEDARLGSSASLEGTSVEELRSHAELVRSASAFPETNAEKKIFFGVLAFKALFIVLSVVLMWMSYTHTEWICDMMEALQLKVKDLGWAGALLFVVVYVVVTVLFVPAEILTVASGFMFPPAHSFAGGFILAFFLCMIAQYISTAICFTLARWLLFNPIRLFCGRFVFYQAFMAAVEEGGALFVALIRLSPTVPFTLSNYLLGVTSLKLHSVLLGASASAPLVLLMIWIGTALGDIREIVEGGFRFSPFRIVLMVMGAVFALIAIVFIAVKTKRKLDEAATAIGDEGALARSHSSVGQNLPLLLAENRPTSVAASDSTKP